MDGIFNALQIGLFVLLVIPGSSLQTCKQKINGTWKECKIVGEQARCREDEPNTTIYDALVIKKYQGNLLNSTAFMGHQQPGFLELCVDQEHRCWHALIEAEGETFVAIGPVTNATDVNSSLRNVSETCIPKCFLELCMDQEDRCWHAIIEAEGETFVAIGPVTNVTDVNSNLRNVYETCVTKSRCPVHEPNTTINDALVIKKYHGNLLNLTAFMRHLQPGFLELCVDQEDRCWYALLDAEGETFVAIGPIINATDVNISIRNIADTCTPNCNFLRHFRMQCFAEFQFHPINNTAFRFEWLQSEWKHEPFSAEIYTGGEDLHCAYPDNVKVPCSFSGIESLCTNMSHGYYCAKIKCRRCSFHTTTANFTGTNNYPVGVETENNEGAIAVVMASVAVFLVFGGVFLASRYAVSQRRARVIRLNEEQRSCDDEVFPMLTQPTVLLLYSYDGGTLSGVMSAFKVLLQAMGAKVLDPLEGTLSEEVAMNPLGWLLEHLNTSCTKIIIVLTDGAAIRQRALLSRNKLHIRNLHSRDDIFTYALQYLHEDSQVGRDYRRVLIVRFHQIPSQVSHMPLIVPLQCIALLDHLDYLCRGIGTSTASLAELKVIYKSEIESLQRAINDAIQFVHQNPNYLSTLYLLEEDEAVQENHIAV